MWRPTDISDVQLTFLTFLTDVQLTSNWRPTDVQLTFSNSNPVNSNSVVTYVESSSGRTRVAFVALVTTSSVRLPFFFHLSLFFFLLSSFFFRFFLLFFLKLFYSSTSCKLWVNKNFFDLAIFPFSLFPTKVRKYPPAVHIHKPLLRAPFQSRWILNLHHLHWTRRLPVKGSFSFQPKFYSFPLRWLCRWRQSFLALKRRTEHNR